ncbi:PREDICTED: lymphocyte transmembrane adapter 1 [Chrysochloris asiatica]|uniref:Lymphocyte transmembrane adapter 1 n=1 Tax=Chrysochloris asiatica TaxID=185453 RepID=A0A9B0T7J3_CHRAS|nr:PREDICTED: lymphocyte transmembrane adapter 1 [Chrysochloris asiatica]
MDHSTPALAEIKGRTLKPNTLQVTLGIPNRNHQSIGIFSVIAGLLATLLIITILCILWSWKKRPVPYFRVTAMSSLTLPQYRQRPKNIYDFLPRRPEEPGRHQSRNIRVFSTESLLSRNSNSPTPHHASSCMGNAVQVRQGHTCTVAYVMGVYDNAMVPQMCRTLTPSAYYINVGASRDDLSISSEDSRDYVNVPRAEEITVTVTSTSPGNLFVLPRAQELDFPDKRDMGHRDTSEDTRVWSPGTESDDQLSDEESSSQTSNDYVNMSEFNLGATQAEQSWMTLQCSRDYENVPSADADGGQQQAGERVTSLNIDPVEGRTDALGTHMQPVMQSGRFLVLVDHMTFQPLAQSENSQMKHGEESSSEDDSDYERVLPANLEYRDSEQGLDTQLLPDELRPSHPAGKLQGVVYPAVPMTSSARRSESPTPEARPGRRTAERWRLPQPPPPGAVGPALRFRNQRPSAQPRSARRPTPGSRGICGPVSAFRKCYHPLAGELPGINYPEGLTTRRINYPEAAILLAN